MTRFALAAGLLLSLGLTSSVLSGDTYEIDPQHAWVILALNHNNWATATGSFDDVSGTISFDKEDVTKSSVTVEISTASVRTGFANRDRDMQSPDFLNTAEFPTATFKSVRIEKTGENTALITGDLTIVGVTRPLTLTSTWNGETPLPWDASALKSGFTATGTILPADYGIAKFAEFGLGPEIALSVNVEAFKK